MSFSVRYYSLGTILVLIVTRIVAYHFDEKNVILYENPAKDGPRGSYFGYSLALWNPDKSTTNESWIFIGAPRANSSVYFGAREPGTVFKCKIGESKLCVEWSLNVNSDTKPTSGSWLGGAISIENKSNPQVLVCGPKWTNKRYYNLDLTDPNWSKFIPGMCYWGKADQTPNSPYPFQNPQLETSPFFGEYQGFVQQAGFSTHIVPGSSPLEFLLGCPRAYSLHGRQIRYRQYEEGFFMPKPLKGRTDTFDYSGYAVTSGKYFNAQERIYVTGVPRGANLNGEVHLFKFPSSTQQTIKVYLELHGRQMGEYFGSALASCDIDGDELDDLLIGAPQWSTFLDEGRVYVFRGTVDRFDYSFKTNDYLEGRIARGRFGSAVTCLGDIDYDGYADVAVGAPYDGNGAVHIFHGSKSGLIHRQTIYGSEKTKGFGFAISEPRDIDNNGYADIAVGAYLSGHVTLIRSKRVVITTATIITSSLGESLDLTAESFSVNVCSSYRGINPPQQLSVTVNLKIDEVYERATVEINGTHWRTYEFRKTLSLQSPNSCEHFKIKINKEVDFNYFEPLALFVSQHLDETRNIYGRDHFHISDAVMKDLMLVEDRKEIPFKVKCNDNICYSNVSIEMATGLENGTAFVIGTQDLKMDITINNIGDNAFLVTSIIDLPIFIGIIKMPSNCKAISKSNSFIVTQMICNIGNPLKTNETRSFSLDLDTSKVPIDTITDIKFNAMVQTMSDNSASVRYRDHLSITSVMKADIGITGKSDVDWVSYIQTQEEEQLPIVMFKHVYEIKNYESSPLAQAVFSISIPTHWSNAESEIEIVRLNKTVGELDGKEFYCQDSNETSNTFSSRFDAATVTEWLIAENSSESVPRQTEKKFTSNNGKVFSATPDNRTLYINTTNPLVKWKTIDCMIGPFKTASSTAKVVLTFNILLSSFGDKIMQDEDIIFFATNASTKITMPLNFTQTVDNKPDATMIGTRFIVSRQLKHQVATWVIGTSIFIGVLLLILVIFGLFKFGFFERNKKLKLDALMKENEDIPPRVDLQTIEDS